MDQGKELAGIDFANRFENSAAKRLRSKRLRFGCEENSFRQLSYEERLDASVIAQNLCHWRIGARVMKDDGVHTTALQEPVLVWPRRAGLPINVRQHGCIAVHIS